MFNFAHGSHGFSVCDLEAGAALHTEGAEDGSEDGDLLPPMGQEHHLL